jgi:hypothetical protein
MLVNCDSSGVLTRIESDTSPIGPDGLDLRTYVITAAGFSSFAERSNQSTPFD